MQKSILAVVLASSVSLAACATDSRTAGDVAQGAAIGAAGGAAVGAVVPGVNVIEGAAVGAAIGGLAGAVWADQNNDGRVDGYDHNGQYYQGAPTGAAPAPTYTAPPATMMLMSSAFLTIGIIVSGASCMWCRSICMRW